MSKPAAPPKSNFVTSLLLMVAVFLTFKLFLDPTKSTPTFEGKEIKTSQEAYAKLVQIDNSDAKSHEEAQKCLGCSLEEWESATKEKCA